MFIFLGLALNPFEDFDFRIVVEGKMTTADFGSFTPLAKAGFTLPASYRNALES
jgi:hypothetical protein